VTAQRPSKAVDDPADVGAALAVVHFIAAAAFTLPAGAAQAQAPAGEHAFRVSVRDSEGKTEFKLTVQ